jgi:hypothetical protein
MMTLTYKPRYQENYGGVCNNVSTYYRDRSFPTGFGEFFRLMDSPVERSMDSAAGKRAPFESAVRHVLAK